MARTKKKARALAEKMRKEAVAALSPVTAVAVSKAEFAVALAVNVAAEVDARPTAGGKLQVYNTMKKPESKGVAAKPHRRKSNPARFFKDADKSLTSNLKVNIFNALVWEAKNTVDAERVGKNISEVRFDTLAITTIHEACATVMNRVSVQ